MPLCRLNENNVCVADPNIYWDQLDQRSRDLCRQTYPNCGTYITIPTTNINRGRTQTYKSPTPYSRKRKNRRSRRKSRR